MWKKGPLPKGTYGWGGVVPHDMEVQGFYFASFEGNRVRLCKPDGSNEVIKDWMVKYYTNPIQTSPPYVCNECRHTIGALAEAV